MASDRKSTRLNSSHTEIYTLSLHDAFSISEARVRSVHDEVIQPSAASSASPCTVTASMSSADGVRSEEHTSELQSHRDLHSFPTRRLLDLRGEGAQRARRGDPAECRLECLTLHGDGEHVERRWR